MSAERKGPMPNIHVDHARKQLENIPLEVRGETRTKLVPWIFTNDHDFARLIPEIEMTAHQHPTTGLPRAAVLSGVGSLLTIASYVDVDFFVSVDRNSFVLDEVKRMVSAIQRAPTPDIFERLMGMPAIFSRMESVGVNIEEYWEMEKESFGDKHFMASQDNYNASRKALIESSVLYSQGNFTYAPYVEALGQALRGTDITYASYTDLAEWYPAFLDVVPLLGVANDGVIAWSSNKGQTDARPVAKLSLTPNQYLAHARDALADNTVTYFQEHV